METKSSQGNVTMTEESDVTRRSFLKADDEDERGAAYSRRRSVHFVSDPTTVIVPGSEEKEHRGAGGDGPAVRVKEVHPGVAHDDDDDESDDSDNEERRRLNLAKEIARRQSEPAFMSGTRCKIRSRPRSPPPLRLKSSSSEEGDSEHVAKSISEDSNKMASTQQDLTRLIQRLEAVTTRLEKVPAGGGSHGGPSAGPSSVSVQAFDKILAGPFNTYLELSKKISEDVAKQSSMVETAFVAQRAFLDIASKAKKPSDNELNSLLKPTSDTINEIQTYREAQRRSQYFNHLSAISESIPALGWVSVSPAPAPFVKDMCDAGQFYTNRVLKDWKDKSKTHVEWTKAWLATLTELHAFVKENHTTGLVWNPSGVDASKASSAGSQPSAGGPPPPPPPPPPGLFSDIPSSDKSEAKAINALFADINRGEDVTKGLKKVTSDMQTHKNPNLREGAPPIAPKPKAGSPASSGAGQAPTQRPPRFELEGKKWAIEFHKNHPNLVVEDTDMNQSVYVYRCEGSTIKVEGKVNNIIVDGCKKTAIVFQDVVSSCEFINCQSVQMQVLGKVPTISVEKTDGCQMFLSADSLGVEIVSAKSSEMNVVIPAGDDFVEQPVPEQFKTVIKGTKLITTIAESV